jgi:hypothetical protein
MRRPKPHKRAALLKDVRFVTTVNKILVTDLMQNRSLLFYLITLTPALMLYIAVVRGVLGAMRVNLHVRLCGILR